MRVALRFLCLAAVLALSGCGVKEWWLGAEHGALFQGFDTVVRPGEPATLRVSLRGGLALRGLSDYTVFLYGEHGRQVGVTKTDREGIASFTIQQARPGLYRYRAALDPAEVGSSDVPMATVQAGVYEPQTKFLIIDLDGTLVSQGFEVALLADPAPMPHSREALLEVAPTYQPLYLTHRPEYLGRRSRLWLADHRMPRGPLIVGQGGQWEGSEAQKTKFIEQLRERFPARHAGVGDKDSDIRAYLANEMIALLIVQPAEPEGPGRAELAVMLETLPEQTQVVTDWRQIAQVLTGQASFPLREMRHRLEEPQSQSGPSDEPADGAAGEARP
jgi:hypothetical protein